MKKRIIIITLITLIGLILIFIGTNPKVELWEYKKLPNNYIIKKTGEIEIKLGKEINKKFSTKRNQKQIGVEEYIAEFSYGEKYITLKCLNPNEKENSIDVKFYIIDTEKEDIYGPYNLESTYLEVKEEIVDEELGEWIKTITQPTDAITN